VDDPDAGDRSAGGAVDRLLVDLARWMGDERAADAARSRTTERWLRQQVSDGARLAGVALDLAERRSPVVVRTQSGRVHRGALVAVATDFWVLATDAGHPCLLAATAVGSLRIAPDARGATWDPELTGDRGDVLDMRLADALAVIAGERPQVVIAVGDDREVLAGELRTVGVDVLILRQSGRPPAVVYVPLSSVTECSILASG